MATIVFFPRSADGPVHNCVGMAQALRHRGHRVVFVVDLSLSGTLAGRGFEERLVQLDPAEPRDIDRRPTIEQLDTSILPTWQALVDGSKEVDGRLREIFDDLRPDAIVADNVVGFAAVVDADCPWVRVVSCNPLEIPDPEAPPAFSGYPTRERSGWDEFRDEYRRTHADLHADFEEFMCARAPRCPSLPELEFIHRSAYLNLFLYPEEADYARGRPLGPMWERLDSCVRSERHEVETPDGDGALVYLNLGSLGSADEELMQRLAGLLEEGGYRAIVADGLEPVPQPAILPGVDVVITHGGNNTVTECLHFGKPMVVLPLFWDQYDNAQRMDELGLGVRLPAFEFEDAELSQAIDGLIANEDARGRLKEISSRLQANPGTEKAADCIESVLEGREPRARARAI